MRHTDHVVVEGSRGQPDPGWKLVVEQRQLRDQPLGLLLLGWQRCQTLPDAEQRLDELPLRTETLRLKHRGTNREPDGGIKTRKPSRHNSEMLS